jgi:Flp pilus assembly protein TadD
LEIHLLAARASRLAGDVTAAEQHLNTCLKLRGGATEAVQLEFLLMRVQTGDVDAVAPILLASVESGHPESPLILETLARAYTIRLRYKLAWACLSRWIELSPNESKAFVLRGWVLERLDNHKAGREDYYRALELDPDSIPARLRIAEMLLQDKQAPEAEPHLERLYKLAPNSPQVQGQFGVCRFLQGRREEARRFLEAAVVHLPHDPALNVALASLDLQDGRGLDAERRLRALLKKDPSDTEALYVLVSALQLQGKIEESTAALAEFEEKRKLVERVNLLLKDVADSPSARADDYAEIGQLFFQIGRSKYGIYWSERALELDPRNQEAHKALAAHYEQVGDTTNAAYHRRQLFNSK